MKKYFTFEEAKTFCVQNKITTNIEYRKNYKKAEGMLPSLPTNVYEEWSGWPDFLSTKKEYPSFKELREMVIDKVRTSSEYFILAKIKGFPLSPNLLYSEWDGWANFLNTKKRFLDYEDAIEVVFGASDIVGVKTYQSNYKNYKGLPSMPQDMYVDNWVDWYTFLSKDRRKDQFLSYEECKDLSSLHNIKSSSEYKLKYRSISNELPSDPSVAFKDNGWESWSSFLSK